MAEEEAEAAENMVVDEESSESELEEDDYDLIEENLGVKLQRKKFKRVRRISDSDDEANERPADDREAIAQQLFEGSDNEEDKDESVREEANRDHYSSASEDEYSETDDFIVDDQGHSISESRRLRKRRLNVPDAVVQEAQDIFGVGFDFEEFERFGEIDSEDDSEEDAYEDDSAPNRKKPRKRGKSIHEIYEPLELERAGYTSEDMKIRSTDVPERFQTRAPLPVKLIKKNQLDDLIEEAEWICRKTKLGGTTKRFVPIQPPAQSEANWGRDWDSGTVLPNVAASVVNAEPIPPPPATTSNWENEDWESATTTSIQGTGSSKANVSNNEKLPPPEDSVVNNGGWDNDILEKGTIVSTVTGVSERDFVDWKRPAVPPKRVNVPPPPPSTPAAGDDWENEGWETSTTVQGTSGGVPAPPASAAESLPVVDPAPLVEDNNEVEVIPKIRKALELIRCDIYEVPFIAFYRKECVNPELSVKDLWKIYRLDAEYCLLQEKKEKLHKLFNSMRQFFMEKCIHYEGREDEMEDFRVITDEHLERIKDIKSVEELKDNEAYFRLHYGNYVQDMNAVSKQREQENQQSEAQLDVKKSIYELKRKSNTAGSYSKCIAMGFISEFMKKVGITSEKFAENVRDKYQRHEVEQWPIGPLEVATEIIIGNSLRSKPTDVLSVAHFVFTSQIANEPLVRDCVRKEIFNRAVISCHPTKQGRRQIDESHPCFIFKYLKEKPVKSFKEDEFLKLVMAEKARLIELNIDPPKGYFDEIKQLITRDEFSKTVQDWNHWREECLKQALEKHLCPTFVKELRQKLLDDCYEHIFERCSNKLHHWLKVAPLKASFPDEDEIEWDTSEGIRVLAIAFDLVVDRFGAVATVLRPDGEPDIRSYRRNEEPTDRLKLTNLLRYKSKEKEEDLELLKNYIRDMKPHVVVVAGESRDAVRLKEDIGKILESLVNDEAFPTIKVEILDNEAAKAYANSKRSISDLGSDYSSSTLLRQAISLARRAQDPLLELAQLWNPDEDILCLKFHPLQHQVPKERLLERLEVEFINRTCEVGVDINRAVKNPHTSSVVQFIGGLGPRKAAATLRKIRESPKRILESREQLLSLHCMGKIVFINCAGFVKIDTKAIEESADTFVHVLDGTRVHPESYEYAQRMAADALRESDDHEINEATAVEEILEDPDPASKLNDLAVEDFAEHLKTQGVGDKLQTLYDILEEFKNKYKDMRSEYSMEPDELFNLLTKETPETLYVGKLVTVTVGNVIRKKPKDEDQAEPIKNYSTGKWSCGYCGKNDFPELTEVWSHLDTNSCPGPAVGVRVYLENGICGFIPVGKLSDKPVINPDERVCPGQTIYCRISKIDPERFSVELTSRTSDLLDAKNDWKPKRDLCYDDDREEKDTKKMKEEEERKQAQSKRQVYVKRIIVHPSFKNVSYEEADKLLETMDQGEVIVRPSSKGPSHLTVTWKVADGVSQHIDVREEGKANAFALGQSLWIGDEEFEDIDEIIARYINPMSQYAKDIMNYRYYVADLNGSRHKAEEYLIQQKQKNNSKIHYLFQASTEYPGKFMLSYLPGKTAVHEFVTVTPEGFRFRQNMFSDVEQLLKWFKIHYRDPPPTSTPIIMETNYMSGVAEESVVGCHFGSYKTTAGNASEVGVPVYRRLPAAPNTHLSTTTPHYTTPVQAFTPYSAYARPLGNSNNGTRTPAVTPRFNETPGSKRTPQAPPPPSNDNDECWE